MIGIRHVVAAYRIAMMAGILHVVTAKAVVIVGIDAMKLLGWRLYPRKRPIAAKKGLLLKLRVVREIEEYKVF